MSERIELGGGWCFETGEDGVARLFNPEGFYADRWWHPEDARAFATAIRPQVNVEAWRTIDSAPKDGTRFIATQSGTNTTTWIVSSDETGRLFSHAPWHRGGAKGVTLWHPLPLASSPTPPAITLADIVALILNLERNSTVQYERECPHGTVDASLAIDIALRVAAEAVLALGNPSPETKP